MTGWKLKTRVLQPIGLDIGHNSIKMIQLAIKGEHISVLAADKVRFKAGINGDEKARRSFVISAIKQILAEGKFRGRNVVSCLPNDKLKITSVRLAEAETDGIEAALRKEASRRFGLDPEKDIINYLVAGNVQCGDEIKNELILFAASDETIRSHIAMLEAVQLRPVAIDTVHVHCSEVLRGRVGVRRIKSRRLFLWISAAGSLRWCLDAEEKLVSPSRYRLAGRNLTAKSHRN